MSAVKVYTPAEQKRIVSSQFPGAVFRVQALLGRRAWELCDAAIARGLGPGLEVYGDKSFHHDRARIEEETFMELADAVFYQGIYSAKATGVIP